MQIAPIGRTSFRFAVLGTLLLLTVPVKAAGDNDAGADPLSVVKRLYAAFDRGDLKAVTESVVRERRLDSIRPRIHPALCRDIPGSCPAYRSSSSSSMKP